MSSSPIVSTFRPEARSWYRRAAEWLPKGGALPEEEWARRHSAITQLLALQALGLLLFGAIRGFDLLHLLAEVLIPFTCAVIARTSGISRQNRAIVATFGLVAVSGIFVHLSGGTIEGHFHFFIMLAVISLYQEWKTFVLAIVFVALHHGVIGTLDPDSVYDHMAAISDPWTWALIHAVLVLGESVALVAAWRFSEQAYEREARTGRQLIEEARRRRDEQAQASAALERREAQLEEAQAIAKLGSWDLDLATDVVEASDELRRLFGFTDDAINSNFDEYMTRIHPDDRSEVDQTMETALESHADYSCGFRVVRPDGSVRHLSAVGKVVTDEEGTPVRLVGTCQDVTDREILERKLGQAQKMDAVGQLAGGIAHDFNNLLAVIASYGQFALDAVPENDPLREDLKQIITAGRKGAALTRQLLTFSRKEVVRPVVFSPADAIAETQKLLARALRENIRLSTEMCAEVWDIKMDRGELEQVLMNLAINAQDAMPGGGAIIIEADNVSFAPGGQPRGLDVQPGNYVRISVSDTGVGMTRALQSRIFEPFFTTKGVGEGTGLGLATVYGIVTRAGGGLSLYSEPGEGTTFRVYLPRCTEIEDDVPTEPTFPEDLNGHGQTVLVVEDEDAVLALTVRILGEHGYSVFSARNGVEALEMIGLNKIDLIVTDVVMPEMSGRELADRAGIKTLFMSGYTNQLIATQGILADHEVLVQKPFSHEELLVAVRDVLAQVPAAS